SNLTLNTGTARGNVVGVYENGVPTNLVSYGPAAAVNIGDGLVGVQHILGTVDIQNPSYATTILVDDRANTGVYTGAHMGTIPGGEPGRGYITGLGLAADINFKYLDTASVTIHTSTANGDAFGVWENGFIATLITQFGNFSFPSGVTTNLISHGLATVNIGDGIVGVQSILGTVNIQNPSATTTVLVHDTSNT